MMTREQLRGFVDEAERKQQMALVIWRNWRVYEEYQEHYISTENEKMYQNRLRRTEEGVAGRVCYETSMGETTLFITVPTKEMKTSPELFEKVLNLLQTEEPTNPVVLEPMHELSELCGKE